MRALAILLIAALFLGCTANETSLAKGAQNPEVTTPPATTPAPQQEEKVYKSEKLGFEARYPASWRVVEDKIGEAELVFFLAPRGSYGTANINVARDVANLSLVEYVNEMKNNTATLLKNYTIISEGEKHLGGHTAYELVYTYMQGPYTIKNHAVFVKAGENVYLITLASAPEEYERHEKVFENFVESFRVK
jgi:hypothetical protein